jgi:hypothetical protein
MVPQPVLAVILLFPITPSSEAERREGDEKIKNNQIHRVDPTVLWIKQTVCASHIPLRIQAYHTSRYLMHVVPLLCTPTLIIYHRTECFTNNGPGNVHSLHALANVRSRIHD